MCYVYCIPKIKEFHCTLIALLSNDGKIKTHGRAINTYFDFAINEKHEEKKNIICIIRLPNVGQKKKRIETKNNT